MSLLRALVARLRALPPLVFDTGLAALLLAEALFELFLITPITGVDAALIAATLAVMAGALAVRRRVPVTTLAVVLAGFIVVLQIGGKQYDSNVAGPFFWVLLASYTVGACTEGRHLAFGALVGTALNALVDRHRPVPERHHLVRQLGGAGRRGADAVRHRDAQPRATQRGAARQGGAARRQPRRRGGERGARGAHADRERAARRRRPRAERDDRAGRSRAPAGRAQPARTPQAAFATVEDTGREALTELRRLLGVLRREDEDIALAPQPSLAHVGALVRRSIAAGLPVDLRVDGEPRPLSGRRRPDRLPARPRGAQPRARGRRRARAVTLRYETSDLGIEITDDGAPERPPAARAARARRGLRRAGPGPPPAGRRLARDRAPADRPRRGARERARHGDGSVRRLRRIDPRIFDWVLALGLGIGGSIEVAIEGGHAGPARCSTCSRRRRWRSPCSSAAAARCSALSIWMGVALFMAAFLTQPSEMSSLFLGLMIFPWAVGAHTEGRRSYFGLALAVRDDRRRRARLRRVHLGRHLLPRRLRRDAVARRPRRAQPQPPDRRAARGDGAPARAARGRGARARSPRSAAGSRARCTTSSPTASRRWSSRPAARAASSPATRPARSRPPR